MKKVFFVSIFFALCSLLCAQTTILTDNFEYADQAALDAAWTDIEAGMTLVSDQSHSPSKSVYEVGGGTGFQRKYHNFPSPVAATDESPLIFSFWMYQSAVGSRRYCEIRSYADGAYDSGALQQVLAIGIYNTVTAPETYDGTKYQMRVAFGTDAVGWVNLNDSGSPNRSAGWHKFTLKVKTSTIEGYVDDKLSRTVGRGESYLFDSAVLGAGVTSTNAAWFDDLSVVSGEAAPSPTPTQAGVTIANGAWVLYE
jgi:hypothetical protein